MSQSSTIVDGETETAYCWEDDNVFVGTIT